MDNVSYILLLSLTCAFIYALFQINRKNVTTKLPPGPHPLPIVGNFFELGKHPHLSVTALAKKHGPIMTLKLGSKVTIVVSSPIMCKQVLQRFDDLLSSRMIPDSVTSLDHHLASMLWLPVSGKWRSLRKIWTNQLFTPERLDASQGLRRQKVQELLDHVGKSCKSGLPVDIGGNASTTSLNLLSNTLFSIDLAHYGSGLSQEIKELVWNLIEESARPNIADYVPVLKKLDPQGVKRRTTKYLLRLFETFDGIVQDRVKSRSSTPTDNNDMLDAFIDFVQETEEFSINDVKHILLDLIVGGTDTSASTVEWAMAELLHYPEKMTKVKNELQLVIGGKDRQIQESDISSLPYLQAIVKETLRLHPAAAFLFHKADADVEIDGYTIPKNAQIFVNSWAVCQDPTIWANPSLFVPERFLEDKLFSITGGDFEFIPFGAGRRKCPGMPLGNRMVHLMLASLLHCYDWKLEDGLKPENMDLTDKFGIVLAKSKPLLAIPVEPQLPN